MVGVAGGFAFAPSVYRVPYMPGAFLHASSPSSSARSPARPWRWARARARARSRLVVVARYSNTYESEEEDDEEGGWGRRDRGPDPDYDPSLDIEKIESSTVRLLDEQKNMVGVVSVSEAVRIAEDNDLILAILSLDGDPPVLRLFKEKEYKKHKYEQQKKKKIQQKRSVAKRMSLKELKMGYNIDIHDYSVRLKAAKKFLKAGDKVKIMVNLKGRENLYKKDAIELLRRFQNDVGELGTEESKNFADRTIFLVLVPNKIAIQKEHDELSRKGAMKEGKDQAEDQSESDEPLTEQIEESTEPEAEIKEPEAEVSASV